MNYKVLHIPLVTLILALTTYCIGSRHQPMKLAFAFLSISKIHAKNQCDANDDFVCNCVHLDQYFMD